VRFDDGLSRDLDFAGTLDGVLANIDNDESFGRVSVDEVSGTISWPGGLDLDTEGAVASSQPIGNLWAATQQSVVRGPHRRALHHTVDIFDLI